jgi:hypothetical protein
MKRVFWVVLFLLFLASPALGVEEDFWFDKPFPDEVARQKKEQEEKIKPVDCSATENERDAAQKKVGELKRTIETQQKFILGQQELIRQLREQLFHKDQVIRGLFQQLQVR